ncbi:dihydrodipicolinate synthase family protein [Lacicoccus alkaliphilus]|uniref:4-hydroxy-tetrahydrodipicolinate synthase n=1 Tax=Lacicoccus alkaliphilus DSM 16010 TaxID=1123231 RepID=A0A1M7JUF2_9BACL|nr:dihydrodipicolinate synthase family protein [Salinicoccus alkaliphilus]SHM56363.1 4-hydroxy-tetrahydrodipicolinate synthase [Salinicoccus alkaliphilus DSM 16010]
MLKEKMHVAVPTAFDEDESLNIGKTIKHVKILYSRGIRSVMVSGTTGEQHSLSLEEKVSLLEAIENEPSLTEEMEIIMGVSAIRQKDAEELASRVGESNISAMMLGYPPYIIPSQEEAVAYSEIIIEAAGKPVILYNNPGRTGFDLSAESIITLSRNTRVIGIKDPGDSDKMGILKEAIGDGFLYYAGGEVGLEDKITSGYNRLSSISGNLHPEEVKDWFRKLLSRDALTEEESKAFNDIRNDVFSGNAILNIKQALTDEYGATWVCRRPIGNQ